MKAKDRKVLVQAVEQYLQLKELKASQEEQMDSLKEIIVGIADANPNEFDEGELALEGLGLLKYVNNPPKLVFAKSSKALNEVETIGLVADLGEKFAKKALNMSRLKIAVEQNDREVMGVLLNYGVEMVSTKRLDIKAEKPA